MKLFRCCATLIVWTSLSITLCGGQQLENQDFNAVKLGGTPYFTTKMKNLTSKLNLSTDQQAKLKPIAEQEVGMLEQIRGNPVLTRKEKLVRLQQVVLDSDQQMRPWLSAQQWEELQALRKSQKAQLEQYAKAK